MTHAALAAFLSAVPLPQRALVGMLRVAAPPRQAAACPEIAPVVAGGTQGYARTLSSGLCFASIQPANSPDLVYRSFSFFSDGMLLVFSSYGEGEDISKLTSAREFYFFPRSRAPDLLLDPAAPSVAVILGDGGRLEFDPATAQPRALDRGSVAVSPRVDPAERGGVEFPSYAGLLLDAGFRMGELPSARPAGESRFRDAAGHGCTVKNREIFAYAGGERAFKFSDAELSAWLRTRCPALSPGF